MPIVVIWRFRPSAHLFATLNLFALCLKRKIYFTFLEEKVGSQTRLSIDLEAMEPSEARFHRFKGHLLIPSEVSVRH